MKTKHIIISILLLISSISNGQIFNNDFENLNTDNSLKNWGNVYLYSLTYDSITGTFLMDSIIFDNNYYYSASTDAHNGLYAMELSNALNYTSNKLSAGSASPDSNDIFSAWGSTTFLPLNSTPNDFNFYYKYFPINNDTAVARLSIYDNVNGEIGNVEVLIIGTTNNYTLSSTPINYTSIGNADYYSLNFSTFYSISPGSHEPTFGTRFLIDDVSFSTATKIEIKSDDNTFTISPNPTKDFISIDSQKNISEIKIYDLTGKNLPLNFSKSNKIDVSLLTPGLYFIKLNIDGQTITRKLIIQ